MAEILLYSGSIGINNKTTPHRLAFGKGGVSALEEATDVIIDSTGEIVTRRGNVLAQAGSCHSFCKTAGGFFAVKDTETCSEMYKVNVDLITGDLLFTGIKNNLQKGARVHYSDIYDGKVYFCNGYQYGYIESDTVHPWTTSEWTMTKRKATMRNTPVGTCITTLSNRIILAVGKELIYTEVGLPGIYDSARNIIRFETDIKMVISVQSGIYVSDENNLYFLAGINPKTWQAKIVLSYAAINRHKDLVDPSFFGFETSQLSALMATSQGMVIGMPDGSVYNLINKNVLSPSNCGNTGALMVVDETLILQS